MNPTVVFHPAIAAQDLPRLAEQYQGSQMVMVRIMAAIQEVKQGKGVPTAEMDPPYQGWYRKKFFSVAPPPQGMRPDLRLIYQWSEDKVELRILAIGKRVQRSVEDVYEVAATREFSFEGASTDPAL